MKRQITFIFLAFIMLGTVMFFYVHNILLPIKVRQFFEQRAENYLQRRILIDDFQFTPFKGFTIVNLRVYKGVDSHDILFYADEVHFNVLFASLFRHNALVIPSLELKNPSLHVTRDQDRQWNIADLAHRPPSNYSVLLRKIVIDGGTLDFTDQTQEAEFFESLQGIDLTAQLLLNQTVEFSLTAQLPLRQATIQSEGNFGLNAPKISALVSLENVPMALYLPFFDGIPPFSADQLMLTAKDLKIDYDKKSLQVAGDLASSAVDLKFADTRVAGSFDVKRLSLSLQDDIVSAQAYVAQQLKISAPDIQLETASRAHLQQLLFRNGSLEILADVILDKSRLDWKDRQLRAENISVMGLKWDQTESLSLTLNSLELKNTQFQTDKGVSSLGDASLVKTNVFYNPGDLSVDGQGEIRNIQMTLDERQHLLSGLHAPRFHARLRDQELVVDTDLNLREAEIDLGRDRTFYGNPVLTLNAVLDLTGVQEPIYKGNVVLDNALISGLPHLETVENISGRLTIDNDQVSSEMISFRTLNTPFTAEGHGATAFPYLADVVLKTPAFDLALASPIVQSYMPAQLRGEAALAGHYRGPLSPLSFRNLTGGATLTDAAITFTKVKQEITKINGSLDYDDKALFWRDLSAEYNKKTLHSNGSMSQWPQPVIDATIRYDELEAAANLTYIDHYFLVNSLKGRYSLTSFDAEGTVDLQRFVRLTGKGLLELKDLEKLLPSKVYEVVKLATPTGTVSWRGSYKGSLDDWRGAAISLDGQTASARLIHFPLQDVTVDYDQRDRSVENLTFKASVYNGPLIVQATGDLSQETIPFQSYSKLDQLDLSLYRKDKKPKNDKLSGTLQSTFDMSGELLKTESYVGSGQLQVSDAYLGQLIPHNDAVYTQAHADFNILKEKVITKDARIISQPIDLVAQGWVDFDQNMNFDIVPVVKRLEYVESNQGLMPQFTETVNVKMTGTLSHPIKDVAASPGKVIKTTAGAIKDGIGNIVGEIFD